MSLKTERLDVRIAGKQRQLVKRAAEISGLSINQFATKSILQNANSVVEDSRRGRAIARISVKISDDQVRRALNRAAKLRAQASADDLNDE